MQTIYGVTSGENIVQAFTEENTTEANFHQSINNAAILTFTTTEPLKAGVQFFLTKDPINDYKHEEFMYFEITDQDFDGYEYTYRAEEYAYHDLDTMGYVKKIYNQGNWTTKSLLESITYNDVEPKGIARTKWEIIDNGITLPTTWAGEGNTYTLWYNTPLRGIEKFIEYFGGEIRFYVTIVDNKISKHYLELYLQRGRQTGKRYESNSNLISLTNKAEYGDRYEYIIPLAEGGGASGDEQKYNTPNGFNNYITLEGLEVGKSTDKWYKPKSQLYVSLANDKNAYPLKTQPKGLQNNPRIKPVTFDEVKSKEALFDKAIEWLENNQGVAWSYSASVLDIGESQVGDTIAIIDERSGISSYVRVHDIDYDMIDPENTGVHFGSNWGYENDEAITDMVNTATSVKNDLTGLLDTAIRQSNGKNTNYYGENEPANPIEGDLWYWQKGDESGIKIYQNGNWVDLVDSNTLKHINEQVDKALSDANSYADSLAAKQASEAAVFQSEASAALSSAAVERADMFNQSTSMANNAMGRANEVADKADKIDGKVVAVGKSVEGLTAVVNDPKKGLSAVADIASDGVTIATTAQNAAATAIQTANGTQNTVESFQGDMEDFRSTTTQTASQITEEIKDRKSGDESVVTQVTGLIDQRVKSVERGYESAISQSADTIMASVSSLSIPNKLVNTDFTPDLSGWLVTSSSGSHAPYRSYIVDGSNTVGFNTNDEKKSMFAVLEQMVTAPATVTGAAVVSISWNIRTNNKGDASTLWIAFNDKNGKELSATSTDFSATKLHANERKKFENIKIPNGTKEIKVSFQAGKGNNHYLWKPMLTFSSDAKNYMPGSASNSTTVLQLFNDNFALGIKDNTENIITGINGDSSGLVIRGEKIVVNGDTIFDGNNFMNAAIIEDGSIGTAKIGDLAVTSAKISDLNVDKLTGNVSNFIQSNWTGKYESATIDSTGMIISVPEEQSVTKYAGDGITIARWNGSTAYMAATEWKDSTDEGLQIGIGDDSEFFSLGYQNRKDKVYYAKLSWGAPTAKTAPKGFTFDDSSQFNDAITVTTKQGSDGLTLFGNNFVQLFGDIKTTGNITLSGDLEFTTSGTIKIGDAGQNLFVGKNTFNNFDYPVLGNNDGKNFAGFAYGSSQTYLISDRTYYNVTKVIKALDSIGTLQIPTRMNSNGTAAQWKTVTI